MMRWILILLSIALLSSCGHKQQIETLTEQNEELQAQNEELTAEKQKLESELEQVKANIDQLKFLSRQLKGVTARMVTNYGSIELEFFGDKAPLHVFNFITRAESGFYDGTKFHRIIPKFMIQGGDPNSKDGNLEDDGMGGPIVNIPHEFNEVKHVPGILSMARQGNTALGAGSQFFIMHGTSPNLYRQYTAFGKVTRLLPPAHTVSPIHVWLRSLLNR